MMLTPEQLFALKQQIEVETEGLSRQLHEAEQAQMDVKSPEKIAKSILDVERIQREISDRGQIFAFLSSPESSITSPYLKAELFETIEAAETVSVQLVDVIAEHLLHYVRADIQAGEDDVVELIQAEFKEYIIPAKIIAEHFEQIDDLLEEMNRYCRAVQADYAPSSAQEVLVYAFEASFNADIRLEPTVKALREFEFTYLTPEDRAMLLDRVEERLAIIRYEKAKNENVAMEQALHMIEERAELEEKKNTKPGL